MIKNNNEFWILEIHPFNFPLSKIQKEKTKLNSF